ncbi:MAG: segregation/condensation protein A [Candidatus Omnitrophica bacterium]|nr:segregation/condensation protein A [Candidatus Omnitrophota bacterium]MCM8790860.1 segregation/condensation protein A [Candidatus Omnitrophota bacterium]
MTYKVKLEVFEGPLDLLLYLIKKEEIDIYDIPIAKITDQYLEYLELMQLLDLNIAGEFLVMAATLMHIKSRMLLPPDQVEGEEAEEEDPRAELVRRLLEYKKFKEAANELAQKESQHKHFFARVGPGVDLENLPPSAEEFFEASLFDLITAFTKVLKDIPKEVFHKVVKDEFTVSEKIHDILHMLVNRPTIMFTELFRNTKSKVEIITTFLAILELIKIREIIVRQLSPFGDIEVIKNTETIKPAGGEANG